MAHKHKQISNESFPTEIIREILLKVATVKWLLRCKSVCKEWYSLISDQHFIKSHYVLSSTNINCEHHRLIYGKENNLKICPLSDVMFDKSVNIELVLDNPLQRPQPPPIRIVGSCNGLLCILAEDDNTLFICNPSSRRSHILPSSKQGAGLYGFGYDETTLDYKVVKIIWRPSRWDTMIYSLKAGSWKEIACFPCLEPFNDAKFLNGALYWATGDGWSRDIVSLDLGKETYGYVLNPPYNEGRKTLTLGVFGEWLCVLCNYHESRVGDVWVMKDSWTKLLSISHPNDRFWDPSYMQFHALLGISNDEKLLLLQLGTKLVVYDCENGSYSEIQNFDGFRDAYIIVESLIWPDFADKSGHEN